MFAINSFAQKNVATCEIIFFHEYIYCELLLKNEIQMCFSSNGLEFCVFFLLYMHKPLKEIQEWIFIWTIYEKSMLKLDL